MKKYFDFILGDRHFIIPFSKIDHIILFDGGNMLISYSGTSYIKINAVDIKSNNLLYQKEKYLNSLTLKS